MRRERRGSASSRCCSRPSCSAGTITHCHSAAALTGPSRSPTAARPRSRPTMKTAAISASRCITRRRRRSDYSPRRCPASSARRRLPRRAPCPRRRLSRLPLTRPAFRLSPTRPLPPPERPILSRSQTRSAMPRFLSGGCRIAPASAKRVAAFAGIMLAPLSAHAADPEASTGTTLSLDIDVVAQQLDVSRGQIQPSLGATVYQFQRHDDRDPAAGRQCADQPGAAAGARRGAGFVRPASCARRPRQPAIPHQRRAAAGGDQRLRPGAGDPARRIRCR